MPGGSYGPDFKDAVLQARDGSEIQGDVEIHGKVSDWYAHGHDEDERYGRVIFHAVGSSSRGDKRRATLNALGTEVDEIEIGELVVGSAVSSVASRAGSPRARGITAEDAFEVHDEWLDAAGDERFAQLIASRRLDVDRFGPDLAMQMSVFECLGYPRNRIQFRTLAQRLPWPFLVRFAHRTRHAERMWADREEDVRRATDLLRWAGGFAPKPDISPVPKLAGDPPEWCGAAGRPANRPQVRIGNAAHLVAEWWRGGGPLRWAFNQLSVADHSARLSNAFRPLNGIGAGRMGEIVVNAVLPLLDDLKPGDPNDLETTLCPMIDADAVTRIMSWLDEAQAAGATILDQAAEVWADSDLIVKVKEPQDTELSLLKSGQILFTYLHLAAYPKVAEALCGSGAIGLAYETTRLPNGALPLLAPMSEVAGRMAPQVGARFLERSGGGRGC